MATRDERSWKRRRRPAAGLLLAVLLGTWGIAAWRRAEAAGKPSPCRGRRLHDAPPARRAAGAARAAGTAALASGLSPGAHRRRNPPGPLCAGDRADPVRRLFRLPRIGFPGTQGGAAAGHACHAVRAAIVPGDSARSPLLKKACSPDPSVQMPPPASKKPALTPEQIDLLRRWIDEGALLPGPLGLLPAGAARGPRGAQPGLGAQPHRRLHRRRAREAGVDARGRGRPADPAAPPLLRPDRPAARAAEVEAFVHAPPEAYEAWVDRLLASEHFGERMAVLWLDLVRYADTDGYSVDDVRSVWPFRDWVIRAFNRNLPFDQFTIRQVAGDLVPGSTPEDRVASGYNRLLMTSNEGCANEDERRAQYQSDRVRNLSSVWLGLTMGCAECHDHKFDPLTTRSFYRLGAFFADVQEKGVGRPEPTRMLTPAQEEFLAWHDQRIRSLEDRVATLPGVEETLKDLKRRVEVESAQGQDPPLDILSALHEAAEKRTPHQVRLILEHFKPDLPELAPTLHLLRTFEFTRHYYLIRFPLTLTTESGSRRVVRVLRRGNYLDQSGEVVGPGLPEVLAGRYPLGDSPTRLDLAKWLAARDNPLVARVFVNHLWRIAFGKGLVSTPEDFGTRGSPPTHPELLDWLAVEFMDSGWDVKAVLRTIVTSSAYRQASLVGPEDRKRDPKNAWLARQNSFRFEAEFVRDNALACAGLLVRKVGGPSVFPYQPDHFAAGKLYFPSLAEEQYRRGLYTFWSRNFLHPAMQLFDAPPRELPRRAVAVGHAAASAGAPERSLVHRGRPRLCLAGDAGSAPVAAAGGTLSAWCCRARPARRKSRSSKACTTGTCTSSSRTATGPLPWYRWARGRWPRTRTWRNGPPGPRSCERFSTSTKP